MIRGRKSAAWSTAIIGGCFTAALYLVYEQGRRDAALTGLPDGAQSISPDADEAPSSLVGADEDCGCADDLDPPVEG